NHLRNDGLGDPVDADEVDLQGRPPYVLLAVPGERPLPADDSGVVDQDVDPAQTAAAMSWLEVTSACTPITSQVCVCSLILATTSAMAGLTSTAATFAPAPASVSTMARPIPWCPPVTKAVLPLRDAFLIGVVPLLPYNNHLGTLMPFGAQSTTPSP